MSPARLIGCAFVLCMISTSIATSLNADDHGFYVIVNRNNAVTAVDRDFLREVFLKTQTRWKHDGHAIRPIDLAKETAARIQFTSEVLKKTPSQIRTYWIQRIFSGTAVPPPEAESVDAAVEHVRVNAGAVAYVPTDADVRGTKLIVIK